MFDGGGGIALACCQCAFFLGIMMMRLLSVRVRFDACVFDIYSLALFRYLERGTKGSRVRSSAGIGVCGLEDARRPTMYHSVNMSGACGKKNRGDEKM